MGTKSTQNNNKPSWLINWFSQITSSKNNSSSNSNNNNSSSSSSSSGGGGSLNSKKTTTKEPVNNSNLILPWKKEVTKASPTSSVVTEACECGSRYSNHSSSHNHLKENKSQPHIIHRPSITISLSPSISGRRNSQQTTHSSITTSDDQNSYCRRDSSSDKSVLADLWAKAKQRHPHYPRFHWPLHHHKKDETTTITITQPQQQLPPPPLSQQQQQQQQYQLRPASIDYYDASLPSSLRQQAHFFPKHLKRYSVSSSILQQQQQQQDQQVTPCGSRPNSIIYTSQPGSPNFVAHMLNTDLVEPYWLNETPAKLKWQIKHELTKLAIEGLFSIPELVTSIEKQVLQIGCGEDATWAIEVASRNSRWVVIGLDEVDSYPSNTPKNFKLLRCQDILQALKMFSDATFDFIASRFLNMNFSFLEYQQVVTECIRITKPGGFIEVLEMDLRIYYDRLLSRTITQLLNTDVIKVIESKGLDPRLARHLQDLIVDLEIQTEIRYISLPLGVWGGKLGVMFRDDVHNLIESFQSDIAESNGKLCRTEDELEYKIDIMDTELDSNRAFMNLHIMVIYVK